MFPLYSRLLSRIDQLEQRLAEAKAGAAQEAPQHTPDPQIILDHIAQVSQNARATWFGLLGLLAFVGVTLLGHKDADFFAYGAATQLPLIGITVPVKAFFYTAPVLVAALYAYLHLYLMTLWDSLAEAPPQVDGQPLADRVFPWLISYAALWYRNRKRGDGSTAPRSLGRVVVAVSLALGWLFGIAVFVLLWWKSLAAHDEWLTLWIALCFWFAALVGYSGFMTACRRMAGASRENVAKAHRGRRIAGGWLALLLAFLSWETTEGGILNYRVTKDDGSVEWAQLVPLYPANLVEAQLTRKPPGWLPFDIWLDDFKADYNAREGIADGPDLGMNRDFIAEATRRYNAPLSAPDLQGADLRNANLTSAFLPGADVREARMQGAFLYRAQLQGTNLSKAKLDRALFRLAQLQGANLKWATMNVAHLRGAILRGANLQSVRMAEADLGYAELHGANLASARMPGVSLRNALLPGADLSRAQMQGAKLQNAEMREANLARAQLQGANLTSANLSLANLSLADLTGANLDRARLTGANLSQASLVNAALRSANLEQANLVSARFAGALLGGADFTGADCNLAFFRNAVLHSANLGCENLSQIQLDGAIGSNRTRLPAGLTVLSCFAAEPEGFEAALTHVREGERPGVRKQHLCEAGEAPRIIGR